MKKLLALMLFACLSLWAAVNVNTADVETLTQIKGIGPVKAKAIVDYRKAHGRFKNIEALQNVRGIGPKTVEKIRSEVTVK
ncbi:ComEA family DNA-binding protein [Hydrogenimonas urashimensis]|uniref:ComEA family DNA-binding protein n=1 Tax=Hydrogenimonas urashimensis TaxID=2740515 RepID=UPI001914E029|nr:ComEA family DNA-binding protein [Hydrogenimonas urashimensis]